MPLQPKKTKVKKKVVKKPKKPLKKPVYVSRNMTGTSTITTTRRPRTIGGEKKY